MKIAKQIHAIKIPFQIQVAPGKTFDRFVYSYLIYGDEICLIDSGVASSDSVIFDYIRKSGRSPEEISLMILTHAHPDHIGSAKAIKEATKCTVAAHEYAKPWIEDVDLQFQERPIPGFHSLVGGSVQIDRLLQDGEMIDDGLNYLQSIHNAILKISDENILRDPMELCKKMVRNLGLPEIAINPLVAKSFASHLKILGQKNLGTG